jgi:hypothetical protein
MEHPLCPSLGQTIESMKAINFVLNIPAFF